MIFQSYVNVYQRVNPYLVALVAHPTARKWDITPVIYMGEGAG